SAPKSPEEKAQIINLYDAEIAYADREIGRLLDALKAMGLYDRSLIILTSDHGEAFYEHGHWEHSQTLYDEIIRVPLIVKWPDSIPRGRRKTLVGQVDIFPTLLESAGIEPPRTGAMGLLHAGAEQNTRPRIPSEVTWMSPNGTFMKVSFRSEGLKYIATLAGPAGDELGATEITQEELYDLTRDPAEQNNLIAKSPHRAKSLATRLRGDLRAFLDEARRLRAKRRGEEVLLDESTRERLRSLGYINP
ncbi:MAG: sulfatase, partial [Acidobacteriota bacterium]